MSQQLSPRIATPVLIVLLALLSAGAAYIMAAQGWQWGIIMLAGIVGLAVAVISFLKPHAGFMLSITTGVLVPTIERFVPSGLQLDYTIEILTAITFFGAVYRKHLEGESFWKGMRHPINFFMLGYLIFLLLEFLNPSGTLMGSLFSFRKTLQLAMIYLTALSLFRTKKQIQNFLTFWVAISAVVGAYACLQQWLGFRKFELDWILRDEGRIMLLELDDGSFRKFSFLSDPASFGILMAVSAVLTIVLFLKSPVTARRWWYLGAFFFQVMGTVYSGTRTGTFVLIAGLGLYIFMTFNNIKTLIFAALCILVFGFFLYAPIYGNVTINRYRSTFQFSKDASFNVRDQNRKRIQPYIHSHPFGGGVMTSGINGLRYAPHHPLAGFPPDSGYLRVALEYGWVGLIFVCTLFFGILQQGVHHFFKARDALAKAVLIAATTALFANIIAQYSQVAIGPTPQIFLYHALIALIVNVSKNENFKTKKYEVAAHAGS